MTGLVQPGTIDAVADSRASVVDEWFPVASTADLRSGDTLPFRLLDGRYLLLASSDGVVTAFPDTCLHRGAQLSLGTFDGEQLVCPYHGWVFATDGSCVARPAHPQQPVPSSCALRALHVQSAYGMWWVCLGDSPRNIPSFPGWEGRAQEVPTFGPKVLLTSGPRIVENFLDIAHFPYVHADYLGAVPNTEVRDCEIVHTDGGVEARDVVFWQPRPGPRSTQGGDVRYGYRVDHPYAASLWKLPSDVDGGTLAGFALLIATSPMSETECRVWMMTAVNDPQADGDDFNEFNGTIFGQDMAVVQSQEPKCLPLGPRAEMHQRADRMSVAYRRWLMERGTAYGTIRTTTEEP
jgi:phenylpropionate dioxygenase-like ring-hydroxylating dioxygenase large terminal subunit